MTKPDATGSGGSGVSLAGARILVTGASGFIGTHLCARLLTAGAEVHAVSRRARPADSGGPVWHRASLQDAEEADALFAGVRPEIVYHLGGAVNGDPGIEHVRPTFESLLATTVNLLLAAKAAACRRVVLVGSLEEPGGSDADPVPASPYGAAKWAAAAYGRMFHRLYGTPVVTLRTFMSYGPRQPEWKLVPSTVRRLLAGEAPRLSSGLRELDWIYIDDVADAFLRAAGAPGIEGQTIDIGSGRAVSIRDLVGRIARLVGAGVEPRFGELPDRPLEKVRVANVEEAARRLGWSPATSLDEGLLRTIAWLRENPLPETSGAP